MFIYIHTHDTDCPTLLLRDIQGIDTEYTPCKYRIDAELTQDLRRCYVGPTQSCHRTETIGASSRPK